jgi:hypothetical protein
LHSVLTTIKLAFASLFDPQITAFTLTAPPLCICVQNIHYGYFKSCVQYELIICSYKNSAVAKFQNARSCDFVSVVTTYLNPHSNKDLVIRTNLVHYFFLNMFINFLYMFRATMCPSSGEYAVPMRRLVFVTLYR